MPDRNKRFIDDAEVLKVERKKHLEPDEVLVKLRRPGPGQKPWRERFKYVAFQARVRYVQA